MDGSGATGRGGRGNVLAARCSPRRVQPPDRLGARCAERLLPIQAVLLPDHHAAVESVALEQGLAHGDAAAGVAAALVCRDTNPVAEVEPATRLVGDVAEGIGP